MIRDRADIRISLIYLMISVLWILFSDMAMFSLFPELHDVQTVGVIKGLVFVSVTGLMLFLLLRREHVRIQKRDEEKRRLEEEREEVLARLRMHIERMPVGHIVTDHAFRLVSFNPAAERIFGYSDAEVRGRSPYGLIIPEESRDFVEEVRQQWMQGSLGAHGSNINLTKDGRRIVCEWFNTPVMDHEGRFERLISIVQDITDRHQSERDIEHSRAQLRELTVRLDEVREEERVILSREIHDGLGQLLTGMKIDLSLLRRLLAGRLETERSDAEHFDAESKAMTRENTDGAPGTEPPTGTGPAPDGIVDILDSLTKLTDSTIAQTRDIARRLRTGALDDVILAEAIRQLAQDTVTRAGIHSRLKLPPERLPITYRQRLALYRIAQESLTNVIRHAEATHVDITLAATGGLIILEIADNGVGISQNDSGDRPGLEGHGFEAHGSVGLGLVGMRERAELFGGFCHILPRDHSGTVVHVEMPMQAEGAAESSLGKAARERTTSGNEDT
ncbi:MAG: PAS domain S-box protein [Bacteroidetes bacterium]|nr:PAS domain S-box protein [Bacteroidota bacterium]